MQDEHIRLTYVGGGSNKEYRVHLKPQGGLWVVTAENGPIGGTLVPRVKTPEPVSFEKAKKAYDRIVAEKTGGGYTADGSGTPYAGTELAGRATGHLPQLLNPIEDPEPYLADPAFVAQEKFDGHRRLIQKTGSTVVGINRKGLTVALPAGLVAMVEGLPGDFLVDGELVGEEYHVFDLPGAQPLSERLKRLASLWGALPGLAFTARTEAQKRKLLADVKAARGEGIVLKRLDAPCKPGRPESGEPPFKLKFTQTASVIVLGATRGKSSVEMAVLDGGVRRSVGFVTIAANQEIPPVDAIIEVRYLYARAGGSLIQPKFLGVRDDIDEQDCTASQLKLKAGDDEEDA